MVCVAQLRVTHPSHLELVDWLIHDQFFEADDVVFADAQSLVTIPFQFEDRTREVIVERTRLRRKKRARVPLLKSFLRVRRATRLFFDDPQQVGMYDFNRLRFDPTTMRLVVETNIPLTIEMTVGAVDVEVELTGESVGFRSIRYLPGGADIRRGHIEGL